MGSLVYIDGRFVAPEEATVSIFDFGYLFGDGCFETLRAYAGFIFRLDAHLNRLFDACRHLVIPIATSKEELTALCVEALRRSEIGDAYLRITVSRGVGKGGINPELCESPTVSIIVKECPTYPASAYDSGIATAIVPTRRFGQDALSSRIKSCNYQLNILAKMELNRLGVTEGFMLNAEGFVAEGTVSNVFVVKAGALATPDLSSGCLEGITRNAVLEIARRDLATRVEETRLSRHDLYTADECFVTNTLMELIPVVSVDGRSVGDGQPGAMTRSLHTKYRELISCERASQ